MLAMQTQTRSAGALRTESFLDRFWDYAPREEVEGRLLAQFQRQLACYGKTRAARDRALVERLRSMRSFTRRELESLPIVTKRELATFAPDGLLASPDQVLHVVRATGGTTGTPMHVCWTAGDWTAFVQAMQRFCDPLTLLRPGFRVWNGYNQAHVSGPAFDDLVRAVGGTPIPRHFKASDRDALEEIARFRPDALVVTPQSGSGKGGSLEDLLSVDPEFLARLHIRALLVSSTTLRPDLVEEVREQGVETIINFYGSTEAAPTAISCEECPTMFHLAQGHILIEVIGPDGRHVESGARGEVVVSRIGSIGEGGIEPAGGSQVLRYLVGDTAAYIDEPCACGRTSPRIAEIARSKHRPDDVRGGCERWD